MNDLKFWLCDPCLLIESKAKGLYMELELTSEWYETFNQILEEAKE